MQPSYRDRVLHGPALFEERARARQNPRAGRDWIARLPRLRLPVAATTNSQVVFGTETAR